MPVRRFQENDIRNYAVHIIYFRIILLIFFSISLFRFFFLQIVDSKKYYSMSIDNKIGLIPKSALRGTIYDRNGIILARNNPSFQIALVPEEINSDKDTIIKKISSLLSIPDDKLFQELSSLPPYRKYNTVVIKRGLDRDEVARIEENRDSLRSVEVSIGEKRFYPLGNNLSHVLGYLGFPSSNDLHTKDNLSTNTAIGKSGIEKLYDDILRGEDGWEAVLKDTYGRIKEVKGKERYDLEMLSKKPKQGNDLILSIDAGLQSYAESLLEGKKGTIVAIEPQTGEVLALASKPSFDPNLFVDGISREEWTNLLNMGGHPLINKAVAASYPPGSVFKIITAIAGLESGIISPDTAVHCSGEITIGNRVFHCWKKGGHGTLSLEGAITNSCNVYFYTIGKRLGANTILKYANMFGFGKNTGIDYPYEIPGALPFSKNRDGEPENSSQSVSPLTIAIGQGNVMVTPIQIAKMMGAVATSGNIVKPKIVKNVRGETSFEEDRHIMKMNIDNETFARIRKALLNVVNGGTGGGARVNGIMVAGKTGTAQVASRATAKAYQNKGIPLPEALMDHSWFAGFAPVDDPQIAFAVFIEHGGSGGKTAAPIAGKLLKFYLKDSRSEDEELQLVM